MKIRRRYAVCTAAVLGAVLTSTATAMAQEDTIAFPYRQDGAWETLAMTNDDLVSTGVNIRSTASESGSVVGYLYRGGAAWIVDRGPEWTQISSGGVNGFVKNEYLVTGGAAEGLAQSYGLEGVATTWDDVKLYSGADGGSSVLASLKYGDSFILTEDGGNWLQVQRGADSAAYVPAEDVSRVLLLDTAVPTGAPNETDGTGDSGASYASADETDGYADASYTEDTYADAAYTDASYTDDTYDDTAYADDAYTDTSYTDDTYDDTAYADDAYTDTSYTDDTYDDTGDTSAYTPGTGGDSYYDAETGIYYDADTGLYYDSGTGILYDAWWNPVNADIATPPAAADTGTDTYDDAYTDDTYTDDTYDDAGAGDSSGTASAGDDDTSLLAALIYCEAGNQSYDGMVAVGAVVMNRVYSPLFPNSISEVIYQSGQFTPASSGWLASALASGVPSTCYDAAAAAINGENPVGDALYFNTGSGKGMKLGDHQFY